MHPFVAPSDLMDHRRILMPCSMAPDLGVLFDMRFSLQMFRLGNLSKVFMRRHGRMGYPILWRTWCLGEREG